MLWEHNSTIVVMLTKLREMGRVRRANTHSDVQISTRSTASVNTFGPYPQEKCHQYWPAERSARYQYFVVDPMAEYNMPQYILREFKVTDARVSFSSDDGVTSHFLIFLLDPDPSALSEAGGAKNVPSTCGV